MLSLFQLSGGLYILQFNDAYFMFQLSFELAQVVLMQSHVVRCPSVCKPGGTNLDIIVRESIRGLQTPWGTGSYP